MTLGADGIVLAVGGEVWHGAVARVLHGNPTGAGDAALAAFARGIRAGRAVAGGPARRGRAVRGGGAGAVRRRVRPRRTTRTLAEQVVVERVGAARMTAARTGDLVAREPSGVVAFNVITLEHAEGILLGAERAGRPVVLQVSENAIRYHSGGAPLLSACASLVAAHAATASLHLDHVTDPALLDLAVPELGVSSVMYDGSELPYEENVERTQQLTRMLHERGLWVEAELGAIGGKGGAHAPGVRTDPGEAAAFVAATGVDALAVAVGSTHAMTTQTATLDCDLITRIAAAVPVPLVLHGSSGVPVAQLSEAVAAGIRKINVGTALNVAFTGEVRSALDGRPGTSPTRGSTSSLARDAVADVVEELLTAL